MNGEERSDRIVVHYPIISIIRQNGLFSCFELNSNNIDFNKHLSEEPKEHVRRTKHFDMLAHF
jgi:hypothetical protein